MSELSLDPTPAPEQTKPSHGSRLDDRLIEMRSQRYTEKTALGGFRVGARLSLFIFLGALAAAAFAILYLQVDRRVGSAVDAWLDAQSVAASLGVIERSVNEVALADRRFTEDPSAVNAQAMQRPLVAIGQAVENLAGLIDDAEVNDALVTIRDGFGQYAAQFSAFNRVRQEIGFSEDSGLRAERKAAAQDVRAKLKVIGLELSVPDFDRLHNAGPEDVDRQGYAALRERIEAAAAADATIEQAKAEALAALDRHEQATAAIAERLRAISEAPPEVGDIVDYVGPSLRTVSGYAETIGKSAPAAFEAERKLARQVIAGGSAAILAFLVLIGLALMRTITRPLERLAGAASRLADGDRSVNIPARGNADQIGTVARALDAWLDNLTEIDHLRAELDDVRLRLANEVEIRLAAESEAALRPERPQQDMPPPETPLGMEAAPSGPEEASAFLGDSPSEPTAQPASEPSASAAPGDDVQISLKRILHGADRDDDASRGASPLGSASQELTRFSEFVNAATADVERTETLMRKLGDTTRQIADLEHCVETIRDEAHLLVFRSPGGSAPTGEDDTLVYLSGDAKRPEGDGGKRFDNIREAVDRAERLVVSARRSLEHVTRLAQEIASDASAEALEATNKLLSQSEYLQNMLDDLVHKMRPLGGQEGEGDFAFDKHPRRDRD